MGREFGFEDAKSICDAHEHILDTVHQIEDKRAKDAQIVQKCASDVFGDTALRRDIISALNSQGSDSWTPTCVKSLFRSVYVYDESAEIIATLKKMRVTRRQVMQDIALLKKVNSSLKWIFKGSQTKQDANDAYERLNDLLKGEYNASVRKEDERSQKLDKISEDMACQIVNADPTHYFGCLMKCAADVAGRQGFSAEVAYKVNKVQETVNIYRTAQQSIANREESSTDAVRKAINPLIAEKTLEELRKQDIEILSQMRSGIRIKSLRDHGYRNMADLFAASKYNLSSVHGISPEAAGVIKDATNEVAQQVSKTIKLSISTDDKSKASTDLLRAAYVLLRVQNAKQIVTPEMRSTLDEAEKQSKRLSGLTNNLSWVFATSMQKQMYTEAYQSIQNGLSYSVIDAVQKFHKDVMDDTYVRDYDIWQDFSQRSIEYFNLLEEVCPGVFGNDDLLYGLPEDLAREIQDQVYFPQGLKVTLRRYQEWGVKYILHQGRVLLGDEMGLGKTVQAIATMVSLRNTGAKKFLVVCPASVLPNWCKEIDKKSEFRSTKVHGYGRQEAFDSWAQKGGVAVTTYETLNSLEISETLEFDLLVVDEAHFIKNVNAQRSKNVRKIGRRAKRILYMTGTALENKVGEMLSLLHPLNQKIALQAERIAFMSTAPQFRQLVAPVYYRRKRDDVLTELPAITSSNEWCDLLPEEYEAYKTAVFAKDRAAIRKVSWTMPDLKKSSKARRLNEIVEEAESDGRKILVFSFYLETINKVIQLLGKRCTQPINGSVPVNRRQEIIDEFEKMPAGSVLPAQIQAGGTGLNIQSASVVVICEPQLKPSIENQAISRAYRMGQTRKVLVYRLLASDTIDERIDDMLTEKQAIFDAFADISVAASATQKEEQQIDDKTFGKLIQDEIDRINAENGNPPPPKAEPIGTKLKESVFPEVNESRESTPDENESVSGFSAPAHQLEEQPESESEETPAEPEPQEIMPEFFTPEALMEYAESKGITVKDNREKGGCLWIKADPMTDDVVKSQVFGDRKFKFSAKSKALQGEAGWYY